MKRNVKRGLDYTPLYRFLLSKIGKNWDDIFSEAVSRLDKKEPIFYMVENVNDLSLRNKSDYFYTDESTIYSKLVIDEDNILQFKNKNLVNEDFTPSCNCCTFTFNGKVLNKKFIQVCNSSSGG